MRTNMREARILSGLTAEEAADRIGVHVNALLRWENGKAEPMGSNLVNLSKLYGCSPEYLLQMTDEPNTIRIK